MVTVQLVLALVALGLAIWSAVGKPTLWIAVVLLAILELLRAGVPLVR